MEELATPTLFKEVPVDDWGIQRPPSVCVRLPRQFSALLSVGAVTAFLLPQLPGRSSSASFKYSRLGYRRQEIPQAPQSFSGVALSDTQFDKEGIDEAIRHLRLYTQSLANNGAAVGMRGRVELCIQKLLKFCAALDPLTFMKSAKELDGFTHARICPKGGPIAYRASFLLKAFMQADLLRNNAKLRDSIMQSFRIVLPQDVIAFIYTSLYDSL